MAFAVSRSAKRNRGQYEASNVSQGEKPNFSSLDIYTSDSIAPENSNAIATRLNAAAEGLTSWANGNLTNAGESATINMRNRINHWYLGDSPSVQLKAQRDEYQPYEDLRSQLKIFNSYGASAHGNQFVLQPTFLLNALGTLKIRAGLEANSTAISSDDRLKHNEKDVTGALDTIMKLKGKEYIKTQKLYDANHNFALDADGDPIEIDEEGNEKKLPKDLYIYEKGFIAQEVEADVPELSKSVTKTRNLDGEEMHELNYTDIFATNVCATQELCELVRSQAIAIEELTKRVQELEAVIAPPDLTRQ